ncbi:MAG: Uma2 family endonuclease [Chloroflexales bacterium]|nr:Uma2 family endonuclease [Chloroflexales bacterium]
MSATATQLLTAEEFLLLPENGMRRALVRGEVEETMPPGGRHGNVALKLGGRIQAWVEAGAGGCAGVESGFILARNPDIVRGPDVFYVRAERIPTEGIPEAFWTIAPDLAVEIVSPSETAEDVRAKVREYLDAGTQLVWEVYPRTREVVAYAADGSARAFGPADTLQAPELLPGFACRVSEIFA